MPEMVKNGRISATSDGTSAAQESDISIICVPTPLALDKTPDLRYVENTSRTLSRGLGLGKLIIPESSVYPGVTESVVKPILESTGSKTGRDFWLAHAPERIDYNNPRYQIKDIPKVVGGVDAASTTLASRFYELILDAKVVKVSSAKTAESVKMLENAYRYVNIALVNELAILHEKLGLDITEVIHAAATKPFGFHPHYPGPGVGGHCIPKDPLYLLHAARGYGMDLMIIRVSEKINESMPEHIVGRLKEALAAERRELRRARVAVLGLAYKANTSQSRRSPAIPIIDNLIHARAVVAVHDPFVSSIDCGNYQLTSAKTIEDAATNADCLVIVTDHAAYASIDWQSVARLMVDRPILFDCRNMLDRCQCEMIGFRYLGVGRG
jgi:UDP-N-acetyl-D-glucosamine dehydrogenase